MRPLATIPYSAHRTLRYTLIAAATFLLAAQAAFAQTTAQTVDPAQQAASAQNPDTDPPGRVARLNYTAGTVTTEPAGATDWSYAQINRPLTTGDQLWNDRNARSELHIGSTAVRLGESTSLDLLALDDDSAQLKVVQGSLSARVRELPPGTSYEIDTPNLALGLNGPGDYRVDVAPDGSSTTVTVRSGSATVYGENGQVPVAAGQQIRFAGTNLQQSANNGAPGLDAFDQWAMSRDAAEDRSVSARYVSRDIPGYQDLDANGTWRSSPQYGEVWVPRATPAGWAPYHDGHWVWQAPWGWTWVDDAPWGFAPYHYGRWAYVDDAWAWVPGPVVEDAPPVYAPALVAFVGNDGGGADWGVNLAIGGAIAAGVAWFPLGPGEAWHPHWGDRDHWSPRYYQRVNEYNRNVTNVNVTNIHNTYINYRAPGGLTAVPATAFVHGQPVGRFAQRVDPQQWRNARINPGAPGIAPVRESFGPGLRNANFRPGAGAMARPVMATRSPTLPAAYHDSLAQRFAQSGGRVPGAGQPIVRTSVPAHMTAGMGVPSMQNVRVVQSHQAGRMPGAAPGAPGGQGAPGGMQAGQRPGEGMGGAPAARPGMPPQMANVRAQPAEAQRSGNGVPRPPQANVGGQNGFAQQQRGMPQQAGAEARREPVWGQPHTPMAQQGAQAQQNLREQTRAGETARPEPQANGGRPQQAAPHPAENPATVQQARQAEFRPQGERPAGAQAPRFAQGQAQEQTRQEFHPQQIQQPRQETRQEPRQEPVRQQQPRQEFHPQQAQQQPRQEFHPQQAQQQPHPQQQQQQPQRAEQHPGGGGGGGGNHDDHHRS
ncbi:DUF6600 domain-containing protein [Paraburkholderia sp. BCC1886]|uniref:DUF6600 domain-containing protein n=1 Tax=Paraburkholderia sp. BCC1886 TaxID=2562670 RepID=UPI0011846428|nr:DUF6600 domain-containing protein [Paraburkholderia sp. BCC1886]